MFAMALDLDKETEVSFSSLDLADFNPKSNIHGIYKRGLKENITHWGGGTLTLDDRLKVWPNPSTPGRYTIINGNQRYTCFYELKKEELIRKYFGLDANCKQGEIQKIIDNPEAANTLQSIHNEIMNTLIPVQIKTQLSKDQKFTLKDAKLYTATYDRNHASFDESKQTLLAKELEETANMARDLLDRIARPQRALVLPTLPKPGETVHPNTQPESRPTFDPTAENGSGSPVRGGESGGSGEWADNPWGPPPDDALAHLAKTQPDQSLLSLPPSGKPTAPQAALSPMIF